MLLQRLKPGADLLETCLLFTSSTCACRMYTYIHAEWGNTVMQSQSFNLLFFHFFFHWQKLSILSFAGWRCPSCLREKGRSTEMATPVYADCSRAKVCSMKVLLETSVKTQSSQALRLKPCWCCSWRMFCRAQRANSLMCTQVDHRYFVSACSSISVAGIAFQSYGCNFRTDQRLTYTPFLAIL